MSIIVIRRLLLVPITCLSLYFAYSCVPRLVESEASDNVLPFDQAESTPVILVGRILANAKVGRARVSRIDKYHQVQLYRTAVRVENVLRGKTPTSDISVYYFAYIASSGPPGLGMSENGGTWHIGDREMFFLRTESGVFRTICDRLRSCVVPVRSGAHPNFKADPRKAIAHSIIDLLLTRGQDCNDSQMIQAISSNPFQALSSNPAWDFSESYTIQKLQQIATQETPAVRRAACNELIYMTRIRRLTVPALNSVCPEPLKGYPAVR